MKKIKQYFLDYPTFKKAQTRYWLIVFLLGMFTPWVSFIAACFLMASVALVLGVAQNEDFLFERAIHPEIHFLYYMAAGASFLYFLTKPFDSLQNWLTFLLIAPPHLFLCQQFQFIAEQHNQWVALQGKATSTNDHDTSAALTPFRETTRFAQIIRATWAGILILGGFACFVYMIVQWLTQDVPFVEQGNWFMGGLTLIVTGRHLLQ